MPAPPVGAASVTGPRGRGERSLRRFFRLAVALAPAGARMRAAMRRALMPRSLVSLLVLGFATVAVPPSTAFVISSLQVDQLVGRGQMAVIRAVQVAHNARTVGDLLGSMERLARQYVVHRDAQRLRAYEELRRDFRRQIARQGFDLHHDAATQQRVASVSAREASVYETLSRRGPEAPESRAAIDVLSAIAAQMREMAAAGNVEVSRQVGDMRRMGERARRAMFWHALAAVPLAILMAVVFFVLIARPVRALERSIRQLGDGDLATSIRITGPRDLEALGHRLEWLRTRLVALEDQKRRFLRDVSHELKTPLTTIREGSELLAEKVVGPLNAQQSEVTRILRDSALRLQRMIEDLLAFSRLMDVADPAPRHDEVRLDELVRSVCEDYKLPARRRRLALELELAPVTVAGDPPKLRTIVDNLLSNAVKYSPDGGCVVLRVAPEGDAVRLDVRDQGVGVEVADSERVFEPFFQAERQPPGPVNGTGLGLSIARELARRHGGDIRALVGGDRVESGAWFRLTLPALAAGAPRSAGLVEAAGR